MLEEFIMVNVTIKARGINDELQCLRIALCGPQSPVSGAFICFWLGLGESGGGKVYLQLYEK